MTTLLFVYGTLRRDSPHPMARVLAERAAYLGTATVAGRLYDLGRYPGLAEPCASGDWVHGDLYDLGNDTALLTELDAYENGESPLPAYFDRQITTAHLDKGGTQAVWVYWFRGPLAEERRIVSGRYIAAAADA